MCLATLLTLCRVHLQAPFRHGILTSKIKGYNAEMRSVRVTVEWLFGNIINDFKFLDFKKNLKIAWTVLENVSSLCSPSQCNNPIIRKQYLRGFKAKPSFLAGLLHINQMH